MNNILIGIVKDVKDPKKLGRIRCEIFGRTNGIPKEALPWYIPRRNKNSHDLPKLEEKVEITLIDDDILFGYWNFLFHDNTLKLKDDDYESAKILLYRNLKDNNDDGIIEIGYQKSIGLRIKLRDSEIIHEPDGSIILKTKFDKRTIHICKDSISLGKEKKSAEPGVLGDQNENALKQIHKALSAIDTAANGSPYTAPISVALKPLLSPLEQQIPKTKSKNITLE